MTRSAFTGEFTGPEDNDPHIKAGGLAHTRGWMIRVEDQPVPPAPPWGRREEPFSGPAWQLAIEYPNCTAEMLRGEAPDELIATARERGMTELFTWNVATAAYELTWSTTPQ